MKKIMFLCLGLFVSLQSSAQKVKSCAQSDAYGSFFVTASCDETGTNANVSVYIASAKGNYPLSYRLYNNESLQLLKTVQVDGPGQEKALMGTYPSSAKYIVVINGDRGCIDSAFIRVGSDPDQLYWSDKKNESKKADMG